MKKLITFIIIALFILKTNAQSLSLPYYTGFDSTSEKAGWQQFRTGVLSLNDWGYDNFNSCSTPTSLSHDYNVGGSSTDTVIDWFVSPPFKISSPAKLTFKISPTFYGTTLRIWFGTGANNPSSGNFTEIGIFNLSYTVWNQCLDTFVNITTITDTGYIAFKYVGTNSNAFNIDNVSITLDSVTNIKNNFIEDNKINVHPNPIKNNFTLEFQTSATSTAQFTLYNSTGKEITRIERNHLPKGKHQEQFNTSHLPPGLYFLIANIYWQTQTIKIIITGDIK